MIVRAVWWPVMRGMSHARRNGALAFEASRPPREGKPRGGHYPLLAGWLYQREHFPIFQIG